MPKIFEFYLKGFCRSKCRTIVSSHRWYLDGLRSSLGQVRVTTRFGPRSILGLFPEASADLDSLAVLAAVALAHGVLEELHRAQPELLLGPRRRGGALTALPAPPPESVRGGTGGGTKCLALCFCYFKLGIVFFFPFISNACGSYTISLQGHV